MNENTVIFHGAINIPQLLKAAAAEKDIMNAARSLGYDTTKGHITIEVLPDGRYAIRFRNHFIGIWNARHKTFVE